MQMAGWALRRLDLCLAGSRLKRQEKAQTYLKSTSVSTETGSQTETAQCWQMYYASTTTLTYTLGAFISLGRRQ